MFLLKKIFGLLLMPTSVLMILFLIGMILLWSNRRQLAARMILSITGILFVLLSYGLISSLSIEKLENLYPPLDVTQAGLNSVPWVVVLAGGPDETVVRLAEGIRIYRRLQGARLIVSGGRVYDTAPEAASVEMARMAMDFGVNPTDIVQENISRDTRDEARIIKSMIGEQRFILVTSAYHMPRSMALFLAQGMQPAPAPTGYHIKPDRYISPEWFFPSAKNIHDTEIVVHEVLGMISARIMGQL